MSCNRELFEIRLRVFFPPQGRTAVDYYEIYVLQIVATDAAHRGYCHLHSRDALRPVVKVHRGAHGDQRESSQGFHRAGFQRIEDQPARNQHE